mmetsp:Transcript_9011/g.16632  ORF Transcript_9011/g.16632 Transcript_9011/m.16632 type:complete len:356 (-) Transcript_9011:520-1587(-)
MKNPTVSLACVLPLAVAVQADWYKNVSFCQRRMSTQYAENFLPAAILSSNAHLQTLAGIVPALELYCKQDLRRLCKIGPDEPSCAEKVITPCARCFEEADTFGVADEGCTCKCARELDLFRKVPACFTPSFDVDHYSSGNDGEEEEEAEVEEGDQDASAYESSEYISSEYTSSEYIPSEYESNNPDELPPRNNDDDYSSETGPSNKLPRQADERNTNRNHFQRSKEKSGWHDRERLTESQKLQQKQQQYVFIREAVQETYECLDSHVADLSDLCTLALHQVQLVLSRSDDETPVEAVAAALEEVEEAILAIDVELQAISRGSDTDEESKPSGAQKLVVSTLAISLSLALAGVYQL